MDEENVLIHEDRVFSLPPRPFSAAQAAVIKPSAGDIARLPAVIEND
jgi:hypothetical protein